MFNNRIRANWWAAGVLSIVALLTAAVGIVRALGLAQRSLSADVCVDPQALKDLAGLEPDFDFDLQREAGFITGPVILESALKRPEIDNLEIVRRQGNDAAAWLAQRIRVEFPAPGFLRISYSGERSFEAARLINAIAATYVDELREETVRLRAERIDLLERGQRDASHRLAEKRDAIRRLEELLSASGNTTDSGKEPAGPHQIDCWRQELDTLQIAVEQGEDLNARIAAELAKLRIESHGTAVRLHRPAEL